AVALAPRGAGLVLEPAGDYGAQSGRLISPAPVLSPACVAGGLAPCRTSARAAATTEPVATIRRRTSEATGRGLGPVGAGELWVTHASSLLGEAVLHGRGCRDHRTRRRSPQRYAFLRRPRAALPRPGRRPGPCARAVQPRSVTRWPGPAGHAGCLTP